MALARQVATAKRNVEKAQQAARSTEQIETLNNLTPSAGQHHNEAQMQMIDRS